MYIYKVILMGLHFKMDFTTILSDIMKVPSVIKLQNNLKYL